MRLQKEMSDHWDGVVCRARIEVKRRDPQCRLCDTGS
jgi:hypothetical protein